jgi:hypothetical protein
VHDAFCSVSSSPRPPAAITIAERPCRAALDAVVADAADAARAKRACETFVARALAPAAPCAAPLAVPPALAVDNCNIPDEAGKQIAQKAWLNKIIDDALSVARHVPPAISLY